MHRRDRSHWLRAAVPGILAVALLAGCETGGGTGAPFSVISVSPERAVVSARGQPVAVEPPDDLCISPDSIETSARSAVVVIGDCMPERGSEGASAPGADLHLPPGMPGIIMVAISGNPGFGPEQVSGDDLSGLERYLATPGGQALLGRGGDASQVSVVETRRAGDVLYVLVEDRGAHAVPVLAPRFWRAFVELNDRLTVVSVNGFRAAPMSEDEMVRYLGDQVRQLELANAGPIEEAPIRLAEASRTESTAAAGPPGDGVPQAAPERAPASATSGAVVSPPPTLPPRPGDTAGAAPTETPPAADGRERSDGWDSLEASAEPPGPNDVPAGADAAPAPPPEARAQPAAAPSPVPRARTRRAPASAPAAESRSSGAAAAEAPVPEPRHAAPEAPATAPSAGAVPTPRPRAAH